MAGFEGNWARDLSWKGIKGKYDIWRRKGIHVGKGIFLKFYGCMLMIHDSQLHAMVLGILLFVSCLFDILSVTISAFG